MDWVLRRFPDRDWMDRNGAKLAGFALGSLGTLVLALFLTVLITGEPYGRSFEPSPNVVYPNW